MMKLLDILTFPKLYSERGKPRFENSYVHRLRRFSRKYYRYQSLFWVLGKILDGVQRKKRADVVFLGTSFLHLMLQVSGRYNIKCIVQDEHELMTALRYKIPLIMGWKWKAALFRAYDSQTEAERAEGLRRTVSEIEAVIRRLSPRAVILRNDSLFLERSVVFAAKSTGTQTLTIQHGLFMQSAESYVYDGHWTDHMLVWSNIFRTLYATRNILPEENIHVLGYPYPIEAGPGKSGDDSPVACLLGQPWEHYASTLRDTKYEIISNLVKACAKLDLRMVYRPHPGECRIELMEEFPDLMLTDAAETLLEAIDRYDVFFSMTSTALIEAALRGRTAVQIRAEGFVQDNFEDIGACYSIVNDPDDMERFLEGVRQSQYPPLAVSEEYVGIPDNLGEVFSSILESTTDAKA